MLRRARPGLMADRRGATAVEFALIAPAFLAMLLGIVEFGFQMWTKVSLDYALAQAARCYALGYVGGGTNCSTLSGTSTYMQTTATGVRFSAGMLTLTNPSSGCLTYTYAGTWLIAGIMPTGAPGYAGTSCYYY